MTPGITRKETHTVLDYKRYFLLSWQLCLFPGNAQMRNSPNDSEMHP